MKNGLSKFAKGMFAIFTIKLLFFGIMFLNQSCQTDDDIFNTSKKELALKEFENTAKLTLPLIKKSVDKYQLKSSNLSSKSTLDEEYIKESLSPLINETKNLLLAYGITEKELQDNIGDLNNPDLIVVGLALFQAENGNNEVSMNFGNLFATQIYAQDAYDCVLRSLGVTALTEALRNGSKAALKKAVFKIAKRAIGWVGAAWAAYEFGDCMGWY